MTSAQDFLIKRGLNDLIISKPGDNVMYVSDIIQTFIDLADIISPAQTEKQVIMQALKRNSFRIGKTAAELNISPNTLYRKRKKYRID